MNQEQGAREHPQQSLGVCEVPKEDRDRTPERERRPRGSRGRADVRARGGRRWQPLAALWAWEVRGRAEPRITWRVVFV